MHLLYTQPIDIMVVWSAKGSPEKEALGLSSRIRDILRGRIWAKIGKDRREPGGWREGRRKEGEVVLIPCRGNCMCKARMTKRRQITSLWLAPQSQGLVSRRWGWKMARASRHQWYAGKIPSNTCMLMSSTTLPLVSFRPRDQVWLEQS